MKTGPKKHSFFCSTVCTVFRESVMHLMLQLLLQDVGDKIISVGLHLTAWTHTQTHAHTQSKANRFNSKKIFKSYFETTSDPGTCLRNLQRCAQAAGRRPMATSLPLQTQPGELRVTTGECLPQVPSQADVSWLAYLVPLPRRPDTSPGCWRTVTVE